MEILRRSQQTSQRHFKSLADWDWNWPTAFERPDLERNLTLDFLTRGETVILGAQERGVDWQMKIDDARRKLKSVYPKNIM